MSVCEICKDTLKNTTNNDILTCEICDCVVHSMCVKRDAKKNSKWTCHQCAEVKPAHLLLCFKDLSKNLKNISERVNDIATTQEFIANKINKLDIKSLTEEVQSLSNNISNDDMLNNKILLVAEDICNNLQRHSSKINSVDSGVTALLSAFDNDTSVPSVFAGPSTEKILKCIGKLETDIQKVSSNLSSSFEKLSRLQTNNKNKASLVELPITQNSAIQEHSKPIIQQVIQSTETLKLCGWRFIGEKRVWKTDWTQYDDKVIRYNNAEKLRLNKNKKNKKKKKSILVKSLTQDLAKKVNKNDKKENHASAFFSSSSFNINNSLSKPATSTQNTTAPGKSRMYWRNPLASPVKSTIIPKNSNNGQYMVSRLNEPEIYNIIRNYLAYLHDQPPSVLHEGMTCISSKARIGAEGLPTDIHSLRKLYDSHNSLFKITPYEAQADLDAVRSHFQSSTINTECIPTSNKGFNLFSRNKEHFERFHKESSPYQISKRDRKSNF